MGFTDNDLRCVTDADSPFGLVSLLPGADVSGTLMDLGKRGLLAVPVADFTGEAAERADFRAEYFSAAMLHESLAATHPIRDRLRQYPKIPEGPEGVPLSILMLAASRETEITGQIDAGTPNGIGYPLLTGLERPKATLEALAEARLLRRRFLDRLYLCRVCKSARVFAREVCPDCQSAHLIAEDVVHHYRCGYQSRRSEFESGPTLSCPKCRRRLRHYGVDYDTPGTLTVCRACGETTAEPDVTFRCGDCREDTRAVDAETADWYDYELLPQAFDVLQQGRMPDISWQGILADISGRRAPRDLGMFIDHARRLEERYDRPFTVLVIDYQFPEASLHRLGYQAQNRVRNLVVDLVRQMLRTTDLVTTYDDRILLFLPETPPDAVEPVRARLNMRIADAVGPEAGITAEPVDGSDLDAVVTRLLEA